MSDESLIRKLLLLGESPRRDDPEYMREYMKIRRAAGKLPDEDAKQIERDFKAFKNRVLALIL